MSNERTPSEVITDEVTSWPGVEAGYGKRGEWGFRVNGHEVGHLHGDHAAHFSFGKEVGARFGSRAGLSTIRFSPARTRWRLAGSTRTRTSAT